MARTAVHVSNRSADVCVCTQVIHDIVMLHACHK